MGFHKPEPNARHAKPRACLAVIDHCPKGPSFTSPTQRIRCGYVQFEARCERELADMPGFKISDKHPFRSTLRTMRADNIAAFFVESCSMPIIPVR